MDDDGGALVLVILFGGIILVAVAAYFAVQALAVILAWAYENREEIKQALVYTAQAIGKALLAPHQAAAAGTLYLCRDWPVKHWPVQYGEREERWAVVAWLVALPILLSIVWLALVNWCASLVIPSAPLVAISLGLASALTVVVCYYRHYFDNPPQHHNWPLFLAQEHNMRFDVALAYVERRTQLRLWWHSFWR